MNEEMIATIVAIATTPAVVSIFTTVLGSLISHVKNKKLLKEPTNNIASINNDNKKLRSLVKDLTEENKRVRTEIEETNKMLLKVSTQLEDIKNEQEERLQQESKH